MQLDALFEMILKKPGLYVGYPSVTRTFSFLQGYWTALKDRGDDYRSDVLEDFQRWIEARYSIQVTQNWANILLMVAGGDEPRAFELAKEFWEEFKTQKSQQKRNPNG